MSLQTEPARKSRRLVALCPDAMHDEFFAVVDRSGESAGVILRGLVSEAIERARRGEPIVRGLTVGAPTAVGG